MDSSESTTPDPKRRMHAGIRTAGAVVAMVLAGLGVAEAQTGGPTTTATAEATQDDKATTKEAGEGHCHRGHGAKPRVEVAANAIGISEEDLLSALRDGQSIAAVAQSKNVEVQKVIDALVADAKARLAEKVQEGDLTQAQADAKSENLTERITELVNREGLPRHRHRHGPGGRRFGGPRPMDA